MCVNNNEFYKYKNINKSGTDAKTGFLSVTVLNRLTNESVPFTSVSVYHLSVRGIYNESGEANLMTRYVTNEEGKIPLIELPIIDRGINRTVQYYITVNHFRYYPVNIMNIQIYPNITTSYNVLLTPLTFPSHDHEFIITPEII